MVLWYYDTEIFIEIILILILNYNRNYLFFQFLSEIEKVVAFYLKIDLIQIREESVKICCKQKLNKPKTTKNMVSLAQQVYRWYFFVKYWLVGYIYCFML